MSREDAYEDELHWVQGRLQAVMNVLGDVQIRLNAIEAHLGFTDDFEDSGVDLQLAQAMSKPPADPCRGTTLPPPG